MEHSDWGDEKSINTCRETIRNLPSWSCRGYEYPGFSCFPCELHVINMMKNRKRRKWCLSAFLCFDSRNAEKCVLCLWRWATAAILDTQLQCNGSQWWTNVRAKQTKKKTLLHNNILFCYQSICSVFSNMFIYPKYSGCAKRLWLTEKANHINC